MHKRVLLTGGAGFAGHHIALHLLWKTDWDVVVLDRLSYAGCLARLLPAREEFGDRLQIVHHDFRAAFSPTVLHQLGAVHLVIHNGGETHVERSLSDPEIFVTSNVVGTQHVLDAARRLNVERFLYVSTDEVLGPAPQGTDFQEDAPIRPSNPYSASKAAGEALTYAYGTSLGLPVLSTRTMNLFGERQHPEKFVPMCIRKILAGETLQIHGDASGLIGSRKWVHCRNQADALLFLLRQDDSVLQQTYHIAGPEYDNLAIAQLIAGTLGKPLHYDIINYHAERPGHDLRYSLDDSKLRGLGWQPPVSFEQSLRRTVLWSAAPENAQWLV